MGSQPVDYTSKDYASMRQSMLDDAAVKVPEWTSRSPNDFGVVLIEEFAYMGDILSYYIDRLANEAYLPTATLRSSLLNLAQMLDYRPDSGRPATVALTIGVVPGTGRVRIPAGSQFSSASSQPDVTPIVIFETDSDLFIAQDPSVTSYGTINATQGETVANETVAASDGTENQTYPLTETSVIDGSVQVFVDEGSGPVTWTFTEHLIDVGPSGQFFTTLIDAYGVTSVIFGDGINGRVPSNSAAITATYRTGGGTVGNVGAKSITTISNAPVEVTSVSNQTPASGGTDPETNDQIRVNAPKALSTLHRAVSLQDYANLCLNVAGIAKARAAGVTYTAIVVYLAPVGGGVATAVQKQRVLDYLSDKKMVNAHVTIADPVYIPINITVGIQVADQFAQSTVVNAARNALTDLLNFDAVDFGQSVTLSDVYRTLAQVPGVVYTQVTVLSRTSSGADDVTLDANEIPSLSGGVLAVNVIGGGITDQGGGVTGSGATVIPGAPGAPSVDSISCGSSNSFTLQCHWTAGADADYYKVVLDFFAGSTYLGSLNGGSFSNTTATVIGTFAGADTVAVHVQSVNGPNIVDGPVTSTAYPCG